MPPTKDMIDKATKALLEVNLESFTASPPAIRPFGTSTLSWRVSGVQRGVQLAMNNLKVQASGSPAIHPEVTTIYSLVAKMSTVERFLGNVAVTVDARDCIANSIPESEIRSNIRQSLEEEYGGDGSKIEKFGVTFTITQRRDARVEVDVAGIQVNAALKVGIPNFWDATVDVEALIIISAQGGKPLHIFRKFNADFDLPWQARVAGTVLFGIGITAVMEELISQTISPTIKGKLSEKIQDTLNGYLALVPPTHRLYSLTTAPERVVYTVCPIG